MPGELGASKSLAPAYALTLAASAILGLVFGLQSLYPSAIAGISDFFTPVLAGAATLSAVYALGNYRATTKNRLSLAWLGYAVGIALWFLGEVTWDVYIYVLGVPIPYPSVADVFYLAGYVPLILGVFSYIMIFREQVTRRRLAWAAALVLVLGSLMTLVFIAPVITEVADPLTRLFDFAYPFLDLLMLSLAVVGLMIFYGGTVAKSWLLLIGAILLNVAADFLFTYLSATGTYYDGSFDDVLFLWGYILFALAFYVHKKEF